MNFNEKSDAYSYPFRKEPTRNWIQNVDTEMRIEKIADFLFPTTLNDKEYESSYVCSPYNALVTYSKDELVKINNRILRFLLFWLINSIGGILRLCKVNKNFCINNFLLSTNPYPKWYGEGAEEHLKESKRRYPDHAIMYRSLNHYTNKELMAHLQKLGFILAPSRQVYLFDPKLVNYNAKNNTNNDRRAVAKTNYKLVRHDEITEKDYADILRLYNDLYLKKYSKHNPQFTLKLISYWHQKKLLTMMGFRDQQDILQGIVGLFESEAVITAPLVGYNTKRSSTDALYRMLIYLVIEYSSKKDCCLNLSSGASQFKILRGGVPFIEYTAAYIKHLPLYRRITWKVVRLLLNGVFVPLLKRYQL